MNDSFDSSSKYLSSSPKNKNSSLVNSSPSSSLSDTSSSYFSDSSPSDLEITNKSNKYVGRKRARRVEAWTKEQELEAPDSFMQTHSVFNPDHTVSHRSKILRLMNTTNSRDRNSTESASQSFHDVSSFAGDGERIDIIRESIFGRCVIKEAELVRLKDILKVLTRAVASRDDCTSLISTDVINARFSYYQLEVYAKKRCGVRAFFVTMCPEGHMARTGAFKNQESCVIPACGKRFVFSNKYWYSRPSEQLRALCMEQNSFLELLEGCHRAQRAVKEERLSTMYDYYDDRLFRENFSHGMDTWIPCTELYVFLSLSTDGVQIFNGRDGDHSSWPVMFTILNLGNNHRFRAANALLSGFIPGSHDGEYFESFLFPVVKDIESLEEGITVMCADGREKLMKGFVLFCTADWPGATKLSGFAGHNSSRPCRYCLRRTEKRTLHPSGSSFSLRRTIENNASLDWLNCECPVARTKQSILETWDQLDDLHRGDSFYSGRCDSRITKSTGIKRRPILSRLSLDFANAFPYDAMHLLLQGWVRLLLVLLCGMHPKTACLKSPFVLSKEKLNQVNAALEDSAVGLPATWGRPPPRLDNFSAYKAGTLKSFGLFSACTIFSASDMDRTAAQLWVVTRDILHIAFDPTPALNDISRLKLLVQKAHALFTKLFKVDGHHYFCFTPTTHAILHLPEILESSGPLLNVSQFLAERVMGEVKKHAMSRVRPDANLFHKFQMLFGLKMLEGGISNPATSSMAEESDTKGIRSGFREYVTTESDCRSDQSTCQKRDLVDLWVLLGVGKPVSSTSTKDALQDFIGHEYGLGNDTLHSVISYGRARKRLDGVTTEIETSDTF